MRAVITNGDVSGCLEIGNVPEPSADSHEAIIKVNAFSLNRGELRRALSSENGKQIGWDLAGTVESAARNGSGPRKGARVVGFSRKMEGWAELVALPTEDFAVIPDEVSDQDAATLPVAGLTALYALERCERILGNRILITGATGGVGYYACQLALLMGGTVIAQLRREKHENLVRELGIAKVVVSTDGSEFKNHEKFRSIIDGVGGEILASLITRLEPAGRAILYGVSAGSETVLAVRELMFTGDGRIEGFHLYRESEVESARKGLTRLLDLVQQGKIVTHVPVSANWSDIGDIAERLIRRDFPGKAVLEI